MRYTNFTYKDQSITNYNHSNTENQIQAYKPFMPETEDKYIQVINIIDEDVPFLIRRSKDLRSKVKSIAFDVIGFILALFRILFIKSKKNIKEKGSEKFLKIKNNMNEKLTKLYFKRLDKRFGRIKSVVLY